MKALTIILYFILFGLVGSLLIDLDHLTLFVDRPVLLKEEKMSIERYWFLSDEYDVKRPLHIMLFMGLSLLLIIFCPPVIKHVTRNKK